MRTMFAHVGATRDPDAYLRAEAAYKVRKIALAPWLPIQNPRATGRRVEEREGRHATVAIPLVAVGRKSSLATFPSMWPATR